MKRKTWKMRHFIEFLIGLRFDYDTLKKEKLKTITEKANELNIPFTDVMRLSKITTKNLMKMAGKKTDPVSIALMIPGIKAGVERKKKYWSRLAKMNGRRINRESFDRWVSHELIDRITHRLFSLNIEQLLYINRVIISTKHSSKDKL